MDRHHAVFARVLLAVALAFFGTLQAPSLAHAEPSGDTAEYRGVVERAVSEFEAGNYAEARGLFVRAHELYPNARTHRGLGLVAFELRNYASAVEHLNAALASHERPLTDAQRRNTEQVLGQAQDYIATIELQVTPPDARILVDGVVSEPKPGQPLVLEVGDHVLEVQATGYTSERRVLHIAGRERTKIKVALRRLTDGSVAALPTAAQPRDDGTSVKRRWYKNPWLWAGVAVVAAGAGTGIALSLHHNTRTEAGNASKLPNMPGTRGVLNALGNW